MMILRAATILAILGLFACQTAPYKPYAREVKKKPGIGGLIALKTEHRDEDRAKAQSLMETNCGTNPVKVLEEGEVVVGSATATNGTETKQAGTSGSKVGTFFGMPVMSGGSDPQKNSNSTATTTALKEWNIEYECTLPVTDTPAPTSKKKKQSSQQ